MQPILTVIISYFNFKFALLYYFHFQNNFTHCVYVDFIFLFEIVGVAALTFAASKGHLEIVRTLLQHGALVNAVDHSDSSALVAAAKNGHLDIVGHLLSNCEWATDSVHDLGMLIYDYDNRSFQIKLCVRQYYLKYLFLLLPRII